ncbi:MAG TPA: adenylate kinase [Candidatus Korarchaeota archaeon]|nr:adenylate kinase [Candidatus Korarchaeota archaeon]
MRIVMLGPPGSGKGTHAIIIGRDLGIPVIASGEIFREMIRKDGPLAEEIKAYVLKGELVPDDIAIKIIMDRLEMYDCKKGFVLDGFPRNLRQAEALTEWLERRSLSIDVAFYLKVDREELIRRLSSRRICERCGSIYHLIFNPPKHDEICDLCGGRLYQREDDKEEVVKRRLAIYYKKSYPLTEYYAKRGVLVEIDGTGSIEDVQKRIKAVLECFIEKKS